MSGNVVMGYHQKNANEHLSAIHPNNKGLVISGSQNVIKQLQWYKDIMHSPIVAYNAYSLNKQKCIDMTMCRKNGGGGSHILA